MADIYCLETGCRIGRSPGDAIAQENRDAAQSYITRDQWESWKREWEAAYGITQANINRALYERGRV